MPTYRVTVAGKEYTVDIPNINERPVRAIVDGEVIHVAVETPMAPATPSQTAAPAPPLQPTPTTTTQPTTTPSGGTVTAPLPGTVVAIQVAAGDTVSRGQELCVLEAMKMNNPIRAAHPGTVGQVHIQVGQQVQHGDILMELMG